MNAEKINRINQLARKARTTGLSQAELEEQQALRLEYRQSVVGNLRGHLDHTVVVNPDGSSYRPKDKNQSAK